jgi:predicted lipoprotein
MTFGCGDSTDEPATDDPSAAASDPSDAADASDASDASDPSDTAPVDICSAENVATGTFSGNELLRQVGCQVILPTYASFVSSASALVASLETYVTDIEVGNDAVDSLEEAKVQWAATMQVWQQAEVYQVGPSASLADLEVAVGAQGLRDEIYSWPTVNPCGVDQDIVTDKYATNDFFDVRGSDRYGLDAAGYLLFFQEADNHCSVINSINTQGTWGQISAEDLKQKRALYVHAVATNVEDRAIEIHNAWKQDAGNFIEDFATAGQAGSSYATVEEALNDLSDALFYIEKDVKDFKLAKPAGIQGCSSVSCPKDVEAPFSRVSKDNIIANLEAAQKVFLGASPGTEAVGFDDFLRDRDPSDVADAMTANLAATIQAAQDMDSTLYEAASSVTEEECAAGNDPICHTYYTLKGFTDDLKTRFVEILELNLPLEASGDAD